jgi:hypothetical protein
LKEELSLRFFENRVLWRIFGPKRNEVTRNGENYIKKSFMICTYQILFRCSNRGELDGRDFSTHGGEERCIQGFGGVT